MHRLNYLLALAPLIAFVFAMDEMSAELMSRMDTDNDGALTLEEVVVGYFDQEEDQDTLEESKHLLEHFFEEADQNKDGKLDETEIPNFFQSVEELDDEELEDDEGDDDDEIEGSEDDDEENAGDEHTGDERDGEDEEGTEHDEDEESEHDEDEDGEEDADEEEKENIV